MSFPIGLVDREVTQLSLALVLRDGLTFANALAGEVTVTAGRKTGERKALSGVFLFFNIGSGDIVFSVRSAQATPYYLPTDISITVPAPPSWRAFPDVELADPLLPLWDPSQPQAFRAQFLQTCLSPSISYPLNSGATLVRGTAVDAVSKAPLAGVTVSALTGDASSFTTSADGQFVVVLRRPPALPTPVVIRAHRPNRPDVDTPVTVRRAATATVTLELGQ